MALDEQCLRNAATPADLPFGIRKIGHVVLRASDLARSVAFYTRVLGFRVSDVYPEDMMPGGMVFMRCNADDHGVPITFEGRRRAGVQIAVEFRDPDRYWLEIYWGLDQVGPDGAVRPKEQWDWTHTLEEAIDRPVPGQHAVLRDRSRRAREMTATQSALLGDYPVTRALKEGRVRSPRVALDFAPVATPASRSEERRGG